MNTAKLYDRLQNICTLWTEYNYTMEEIETVVKDLILAELPDCVASRWLNAWLNAGYNNDSEAKFEAFYCFTQGVGAFEL